MKNVKTISTLLLLLLFMVTASAQTQKNIIFRCARGDISYSAPEKQKQNATQTVGNILGQILDLTAGQASMTDHRPEYAEAVRSAIAGAIGDARRVTVIDGKFQPGEIAPDEPALYFDGSISAISTTRRVRTWEDSSKKTHEVTEYRGNITGHINIKDAHTDAIIHTITINSSSYTENWLSTTEKAMGYTINNMKSQITRTLNNAYPLYASIVEGSTAKKDKQKEVYIDLGSPAGVYQGMHFNVYVITTVAGREAKREIGRLKVSEVMGDEISLCKVTKGGKDIKDAIDSGATLRITSCD